MVHCSRCGSGFSPIRAATIEVCPRCLLRDDIAVPLIVSVFRDSAAEQHEREQKLSPLKPDQRPQEGMGNEV